MNEALFDRNAAPGPFPVDPALGAADLGPPRPARRPVECGKLPFLIKRDGTWLYRGSPINRRELVCLFSSVLQRDADGGYWLETPAERGQIEVEDVPWTAVEMDWCGVDRGQVLSFRTNVDQVVTAGPEHPISIRRTCPDGPPIPYLHIRDSLLGPPLEARISRAVYYELVALAVPGEICGKRMLGVWSEHRFFPLGDIPACTDL